MKIQVKIYLPVELSPDAPPVSHIFTITKTVEIPFTNGKLYLLDQKQLIQYLTTILKPYAPFVLVSVNYTVIDDRFIPTITLHSEPRPLPQILNLISQNSGFKRRCSPEPHDPRDGEQK